MNICFICHEYPEGPHGGIGTMTHLLAEGLAALDHHIKVIGIYDHNYPSPDKETKRGVEIIRLRADTKSNISVFKAFWTLGQIVRKWIKENAVNIIECPDSYGLISVLPKFKAPLLLRAHGNNTYFSSILDIPIKKKTMFYEWNLYRRAYGYCAVSAFTANRMRSLYKIKQPISIIYNGLEIHDNIEQQNNTEESYKQIESIQNPIIFSGTLTQKKGIYELVKAVVSILETGIKMTLIVNGKDTINHSTGLSVKQELLQIIPQTFQKNFIFNGHITRDELLSQYKHSKVAVFPSFAEAFAMAPMEAMLAGIPTIYSDACSGSELITDKINGLLINPKSIESIVNAIKYMLYNPEEAKIMGERGRESIIRNFSKEIMICKTLEFYENIRSSHKNR